MRRRMAARGTPERLLGLWKRPHRLEWGEPGVTGSWEEKHLDGRWDSPLLHTSVPLEGSPCEERGAWGTECSLQ